jgi:hypothetical protein
MRWRIRWVCRAYARNETLPAAAWRSRRHDQTTELASHENHRLYFASPGAFRWVSPPRGHHQTFLGARIRVPSSGRHVNPMPTRECSSERSDDSVVPHVPTSSGKKMSNPDSSQQGASVSMFPSESMRAHRIPWIGRSPVKRAGRQRRNSPRRNTRDRTGPLSTRVP